MAKLLQADQRLCVPARVAGEAERRAALVCELDLLVEHAGAVDLGPRDEEELLVGISGELARRAALANRNVLKRWYGASDRPRYSPRL